MISHTQNYTHPRLPVSLKGETNNGGQYYSLTSQTLKNDLTGECVHGQTVRILYVRVVSSEMKC